MPNYSFNGTRKPGRYVNSWSTESAETTPKSSCLKFRRMNSCETRDERQRELENHTEANKEGKILERDVITDVSTFVSQVPPEELLKNGTKGMQKAAEAKPVYVDPSCSYTAVKSTTGGNPFKRQAKYNVSGQTKKEAAYQQQLAEATRAAKQASERGIPRLQVLNDDSYLRNMGSDEKTTELRKCPCFRKDEMALRMGIEIEKLTKANLKVTTANKKKGSKDDGA
ncbi:DgyrCDS13686 [Dimorphilus gyrociliatus]|uniref:DgyrCDS13686 n=1 Tax=Dimorphilus gyrociliatus TaxID=2664684 RepID=A0A7I8WBJ1_9ANNE|nr:DgyrCDS13686 [Dimorphilus gyrociliatus]